MMLLLRQLLLVMLPVSCCCCHCLRCVVVGSFLQLCLMLQCSWLIEWRVAVDVLLVCVLGVVCSTAETWLYVSNKVLTFCFCLQLLGKFVGIFDSRIHSLRESILRRQSRTFSLNFFFFDFMELIEITQTNAPLYFMGCLRFGSSRST